MISNALVSEAQLKGVQNIMIESVRLSLNILILSRSTEG